MCQHVYDALGNYIFNLADENHISTHALTSQVFIVHQTEYTEYNRSHGVPGHPLSSLPKDQTKG